MKTLSDLLTEYQDQTVDNSTTNVARGTRRMNALQRRIISNRDYWWLNKDFNITTVAGTQAYDLPIVMRKLVDVRIQVSSIQYPVKLIQNSEEWDRINMQSTLVRSDFTIYAHVRNGQILLYPCPATSSNTLILNGNKRPIDMVNVDYTAGTIDVVGGSASVVGHSTLWNTITNAKPGATIFINYIPYEILSIQSNTALTLVKAYQDTTANGLTYRIGDTPLIFEDFDDLLWMSAVRDYKMKKGDDIKELDRSCKELESALMVSTSSFTTQVYRSPMMRYPRNVNNFPVNIG